MTVPKRELSQKSMEIFARLSAIAAIGEAQIEANPIPHLDKAAQRIFELEKAIETALTALHGLDDYDIWVEEGELKPEPPFREMCLSRNTKAYDILHAVLTPPPPASSNQKT